MTNLPLLHRELRVRARGRTDHWMRFAAASLGYVMCVSALSFFSNAAMSASQRGTRMFDSLVWLTFVGCCFAGFICVDKVSRERREGTLGLMFLARVRPLDILVGNFGAAGISCLCMLASIVPVLAIPVLMGGVTVGETVRTALALFDTAILSMAVCLWASCGAREWHAAARSAALVLLLFILVPLALHFSGPVESMEAAKDLSYQTLPKTFWTALAFVHGESWLFILLAGLRLRRSAFEGGATVVERPLATKLIQQSNPARNKHRLDTDPVGWLLRRQKKMASVVWFGVLVQIMMTVLVRLLPSRPSSASYFNGLGLGMVILQSALFAWVICRFFCESRRTGELELLLTTPTGADTVLTSQWSWLMRLFCMPLIALVVTVVISNLGVYGGRASLPNGIRPFALVAPVLYCLELIVDTLAMMRFGMWASYSTRSQTAAVAWVVLMIYGVPMGFGIALQMLAAKLFVSTLVVAFPWFISQRVIRIIYWLCLMRWSNRKLRSALPAPAKLPSKPFDLYRTFYNTAID